MADRYPIAPGVTFKDIPEFPEYCIGDDGSVWSCHRRLNDPSGSEPPWRRLVITMGKVRSPRTSRIKFKRATVSLRKDGRGHERGVANLVLSTFIGPRPPGMEACHFPDRNLGNNRLDNLRWGTHDDNIADKMIHGTEVRGSRQHFAKLTEADIPQILELADSGESQKKIGERFGVSKHTIHLILKGKVWKKEVAAARFATSERAC